MDTGTVDVDVGVGGNGKYGCIGLTAGSIEDETNEEVEDSCFIGFMGLVPTIRFIGLGKEVRSGAVSVLCLGELIARLVSGDDVTMASRKLDLPLGVSARVRESNESARL